MNRLKVGGFLISIFILLSGTIAHAEENSKENTINDLADYYRGIKSKAQVKATIDVDTASPEERLLAKEKAKDAANTNDVASYFVFTPDVGTASVFVGAHWYMRDPYADTKTNTHWGRYANVVFGVRATEFAADEVRDKYNDTAFYFGLGYSVSETLSITAGTTWLEKKDDPGFKPKFGLGLSISLDQILAWKEPKLPVDN